MADFEKPPGDGEQYIEVPDERTESERQYDEQIERLDAFFAAVQPGVTLLIERLKPSWCSGLLEEITVGDEAIDLAYFIETWGGQLLSVKIRGKGGRLQGSYKVPLHSYPPLRWGERIWPNDRGERFREKDEQQPAAQQSPVVVNPPAPSHSFEKVLSALPAILPIALKFFEGQEQRRREDMAMMLEMSRRNNGGGGMDISQLGTVYTQLAEVFKNVGGGGGGGGDLEQFLPQALDVLKMVLQPKSGGDRAPKGRLTAPGTSSPPTIRPVTQLTPPKGAPAMGSSSSAPAPRDVASQISGMEPNEAAETIIEALGRMEPGKRESAITHFIGEFQAIQDDEGEDLEGEDENDDQGYPMSR
jgi:hypothetical protein